ncbi:MAG: hypothetical protein ACLUMK_11675 [Christensenellales bacterium]
MAMLLVVGMMIGNVCSAATDFFVTFAKKRYYEPHQLVDGQLFCRVVGKSAHLLGGDCRLPAAVPAAGEAHRRISFGEHYAASMV